VTHTETDRATKRRSDGVRVPGGIVTIDYYRGRGRLSYWVQLLLLDFSLAGYSSASGLSRDIVIHSDDGRELYREGPYDGITVNRPLDKIIKEVTRVGLDVFLRTRRVSNQQLGPVDVDSGRLTMFQAFAPYWGAARRAVFERRSRGG
jgi:hypothetical protein